MRVRAQLGIVLVLAGMLTAAWIWFPALDGVAKSNGKPGGEPAQTLVLVEPLELVPDRVVMNAIGTGQALRSASLHPKVAGEVVAILFQAEEQVDAGQPLVRLDDKHERLAVRLAKVAEDEARRQVRRLEKLAPSGAVSTVQLETARAELESASLRLEQANAALEDRTLFAPFSGVIGLCRVDEGDRVSVETLIATLDDRSSILVEFELPEKYASQVKVGDAVSVRPWTMPEEELEGTIHATDSRIDPATRSLTVRGKIPNPADLIRPGTSFEVRIGFSGKAYPSIREVAVLWSRDGAYVWRVVEGRARKVFVKVVRRDRGRVLVEGPLQAGDLIVVEGVQALRDGQPVEPAHYDNVQIDAPAERREGTSS